MVGKNKGKNNSGDMKGTTMDSGDVNNAQMQNKSGNKKGGAQNKSGDNREYK